VWGVVQKFAGAHNRSRIVCCSMCIKNKTHHAHASSRCKSRARTHLAGYTRLPPLTCIPRFLLGEVSRLGLDRVESRRSVALIFALFGDSFEGNTAIFLTVGRLAKFLDKSGAFTKLGVPFHIDLILPPPRDPRSP